MTLRSVAVEESYHKQKFSAVSNNQWRKYAYLHFNEIIIYDKQDIIKNILQKLSYQHQLFCVKRKDLAVSH